MKILIIIPENAYHNSKAMKVLIIIPINYLQRKAERPLAVLHRIGRGKSAARRWGPLLLAHLQRPQPTAAVLLLVLGAKPNPRVILWTEIAQCWESILLLCAVKTLPSNNLGQTHRKPLFHRFLVIIIYWRKKVAGRLAAEVRFLIF
jgi:hypothetical protein